MEFEACDIIVVSQRMRDAPEHPPDPTRKARNNPDLKS